MVKNRALFGRTPDGERVRAIVLSGGGLRARVLSYGATLQSLSIDGRKGSVILGSPAFEAYLSDLRYFGAIVGPVANRISDGRFALDGTIYDLDRNENGQTTLHGGSEGFSQRNWTVIAEAEDSVTLRLGHPDGLGGFPGPIRTEVTYRLLPGRVLEIEISGQSRRRTHFNPAFHGYWNLDGDPDLSGHRLQVSADCFLPVDSDLIPLSGPAQVDQSVFDYRTARPIARAIDHNLCTGMERTAIRQVAQLTGRTARLDLETTEPGLQVYAAEHTSSGSWPGLNGAPFGTGAGVALEPQLWPDAPNNPDFPSTLLEPGQTVTQLSRFRLTPFDI